MSETLCPLRELSKGRLVFVQSPLSFLSYLVSHPQAFSLSSIPVVILGIKQISMQRQFVQIGRVDYIKKKKIIWAFFIWFKWIKKNHDDQSFRAAPSSDFTFSQASVVEGKLH